MKFVRLLVPVTVLLALACSEQAVPTQPEPDTPSLLLSMSEVASHRVVNHSVAVPFQINVFVPCANGGAGEIVDGSGLLHTLTTFHLDGAGGAHGSQHFQPMGATGVGIDTGDRYRGTGVTRSSFYLSDLRFPMETRTELNNFRWIGRGRAKDFHIHMTSRMKVSPEGITVMDVTVERVTCR